MEAAEFTCEACGETFEHGNTIEERDAEARAVFGEIPPDQRRHVCGNCYQRILTWARLEGKLPPADPAIN